MNLDTSKVNRVEVINHVTNDGRVYIFWPSDDPTVTGGPWSVELSLQDDGRTLKVFIKPNVTTKEQPT